MNYQQIDYGNITLSSPPSRSDPHAPLYASEDGLVASLASNECIFQSKRTGEPHIMTFQVLQAMDQCREFRTLDEHTARLLSTMPNLANQRENIQRVFENLVKRGLLISDQDFITSLQKNQTRKLAPFSAVFIRACDRPAQLERLLSTLIENERRYRSSLHYVILDDSVETKNIDRQRDLLREFARTTGCKVSYVGTTERIRLVERLARAASHAKDPLNWLLMRNARTRRQGGGRSWNLALLLSAGRRLVLLDDDFRFPMRQLENMPGLDPNPNAQAFARFYRNMEEALAAGEECTIDPFTLHLEACGQNLGAILGYESYRVDKQSLRGFNLGRLAHFNSEAHIMGTVNGTYGSSGAETGLWLYQLDSTSRADFWFDRDSYLRNTEAQYLWYGVNRAHVSNVAFFTPFSLDNSTLLPCTNPEGRGEDGLFSMASHFCYPDSLMLQLPYSIGHVQEANRQRSRKTLEAHTPRFNHFLRDYIQRQSGVFKAENAGQRLRLLAEILRDLAGASILERTNTLREYLGFARADAIDRLQHQLEAATDAPVYWQADVREIIQANGKALLSKASPCLGDWSDSLDERACADNLSAELNDMADAYAVWPDLWRYAHEQGEKLLTVI